jgi:preprotein translocase subunit SecF
MSNEYKYDFMSARKIAATISILLVLTSIGSLVINGLQFGLDFTGGTLVEVEYEKPADLIAIRQTLSDANYHDVVVQNFGSNTDVIVRLSESFRPHLGDEILLSLQESTDDKVELRRAEFVGGQVGEELRDQGGLGMLFALMVVMAYVAMRFQFKFSVGAVVALAHDVIIVLGVFSIFKLDFDLTVLAAILAVIGYSLNDTIVVADRIRENFRMLRKGDAEEVINVSLNQTLGRTLMTSITTALVLLALFVIGGEIIHNFALALLVGVAVGTYSSIYVASNVLMAMDICKEDLMPPEIDEELDDRP